MTNDEFGVIWRACVASGSRELDVSRKISIFVGVSWRRRLQVLSSSFETSRTVYVTVELHSGWNFWCATVRSTTCCLGIIGPPLLASELCVGREWRSGKLEDRSRYSDLTNVVRELLSRLFVRRGLLISQDGLWTGFTLQDYRLGHDRDNSAAAPRLCSTSSRR